MIYYIDLQKIYNCQSISVFPSARKMALVFEKCLQPKKPLLADNGEG